MVAGRLGRGVGGVRGVGRGLGEQAVVAKRAVDLIGRDVKKAEGVLRRALKGRPIVSRHLQQGEGADHVGLDELGRAGDRTVDMALGRQVHDPVRPELRDRLLHRGAITDIRLEEGISVAPLDG